ncbi:7-carboxy-7-deazaguanine synthase QueE [Umezawaea sp. NPDC059074]|uniref:7-carboxy-7-deazaguanine synthase QueE n=1 Tax=Umezawaea sp. NPDC059074 TaxID=3346716 RepID=UPI0036969AEA
MTAVLTRRLVVSEVFGPTVQGEGPSCGRRCGFLRLGGCNLHCRWCDTPYTWDWRGVADGGVAYDPKVELTTMDVDDVASAVLAMDADLTVITGGEPLNQQRGMVPLVEKLVGAGNRVEIETNGTVVPVEALLGHEVVRFNVSPKLAHASDPLARRIRPEALRALNDNPGTAFKFVCRDSADLDEVAGLVDRFALRSVWIMPEGTSARQIGERLADLADEVVRRGWNLSTRLHVLAWGDARGV